MWVFLSTFSVGVSHEYARWYDGTIILFPAIIFLIVVDASTIKTTLIVLTVVLSLPSVAIDATLKMTLLHHGALKPPRLPMLLHGADRLADLRLNGICVPECNRQFWL